MTTPTTYATDREAIEAALAVKRVPYADDRPSELVQDILANLDRVANPQPAAVGEIIERIRAIARDHGWAIGVHGSLRRDIDLIAAPWTQEAAPADALKAGICSALGYRELDRTTKRPHGRRTALLVEQNATHEQEQFNRGEFVGPPDPKGQWIPPAIDLSFMPLTAEAPAQAVEVSAAARDVLAERERQVGAEGWTPAHDDAHGDGSMADAAACYAMTKPRMEKRYWLEKDHITGGDMLPSHWPSSWAHSWWKPKDRRRDLVRAGALILAEIERIDRAKSKQ